MDKDSQTDKTSEKRRMCSGSALYPGWRVGAKNSGRAERVGGVGAARQRLLLTPPSSPLAADAQRRRRGCLETAGPKYWNISGPGRGAGKRGGGEDWEPAHSSRCPCILAYYYLPPHAGAQEGNNQRETKGVTERGKLRAHQMEYGRVLTPRAGAAVRKKTDHSRWGGPKPRCNLLPASARSLRTAQRWLPAAPPRRWPRWRRRS